MVTIYHSKTDDGMQSFVPCDWSWILLSPVTIQGLAHIMAPFTSCYVS